MSSSADRKPTYLILSQVYVPDPASVGQHVADAAGELARRGYRVVVYCARNGYDDPSKVYPARETLGGVDIRRLPFSSFGKSSIAVRLAAQWLFLLQAIFHGLFVARLAGIMVSTSPPFCGFAGALISRVRSVPVHYWLMDLNPDQMIAMGKLRAGSLPVRVFDVFNRMILRRATKIVMLDRFMLERVENKGVAGVASKTDIMPPWPHTDEIISIAHADNPFRARYNLGDKFVVMYSGNHSPANPLKTLLDAAERFRNDPRIIFYCIGGGGGKKEVDDRIAAGANNIVSLPYQPLSELKYSLSAADCHVVSIGNDVVGIVHPCKVYGAMAVSRPILGLGPRPSHVSDLVESNHIGWFITHGEVDACEQALRAMLDTSAAARSDMGTRAAQVVATSLSKATLIKRFCDLLEQGTR
jgi:colanic acid biosynthesis glycosyl transferase WcaI